MSAMMMCFPLQSHLLFSRLFLSFLHFPAFFIIVSSSVSMMMSYFLFSSLFLSFLFFIFVRSSVSVMMSYFMPSRLFLSFLHPSVFLLISARTLSHSVSAGGLLGLAPLFLPGFRLFRPDCGRLGRALGLQLGDPGRQGVGRRRQRHGERLHVQLSGWVVRVEPRRRRSSALCRTTRYDSIRDAILACARTPTRVSL